jgi:hypothetical protein
VQFIVDPGLQDGLVNSYDSLLENYWRSRACPSANHEMSTSADPAVGSLQALCEPWHHSDSSSP